VNARYLFNFGLTHEEQRFSSSIINHQRITVRRGSRQNIASGGEGPTDKIEDATKDPFIKVTFRPFPALWSREKHVWSPYYVGKYDKEKYDLVEGMWDHEHCESCTFEIKDGDTYWKSKTDYYQILCEQCHNAFIRSHPDLPKKEDPLWIALKNAFAVAVLVFFAVALILVIWVVLRNM